VRSTENELTPINGVLWRLCLTMSDITMKPLKNCGVNNEKEKDNARTKKDS
jgi:hypothetical protein